MTDHQTLRCPRCQGAMRPAHRRAAGTPLLMVAALLLGAGVYLMMLSPPRPILAVPATLMLALACTLFMRRQLLWVCHQCGATNTGDWSESGEGMAP